MPLKLSLKPDEKLYVGGAVVQNASHVSIDLAVLNDVPLLREKEVLREGDVSTYCERICLCVQMMYMDKYNLAQYQKDYGVMIRELIQSVPSAASYVADINHNLAVGRYYHALKHARQLMAYEKELIRNAQQAT